MPFSSVQVTWRTHVSTWMRFFLGTRLGPYHEMSPVIVRQLLQLAQVSKGDHVVDLGCGDGRILFAASALGARATGFELDKTVAALARANVRAAQKDDQISVVESDARKADLSSATVITLYLSERGNAALVPVVTPHLLSKPAARVVSFLFPMPDTWKATKMELTEQSNIPMFLYTAESVPENMRQQYQQKQTPPPPTATKA